MRLEKALIVPFCHKGTLFARLKFAQSMSLRKWCPSAIVFVTKRNIFERRCDVDGTTIARCRDVDVRDTNRAETEHINQGERTRWAYMNWTRMMAKTIGRYPNTRPDSGNTVRFDTPSRARKARTRALHPSNTNTPTAGTARTRALVLVIKTPTALARTRELHPSNNSTPTMHNTVLTVNSDSRVLDGIKTVSQQQKICSALLMVNSDDTHVLHGN